MVSKRLQWKIGISVKEAEYQKFMDAYNSTVYRSISAYARKLLFGKPVEIIYRNRSLDDFIEIGVKLRKDLQLLINKDLFTPAEKTELHKKMTQIEDQLTKIVEQCCQK
jgi:hypothetical protein